MMGSGWWYPYWYPCIECDLDWYYGDDDSDAEAKLMMCADCYKAIGTKVESYIDDLETFEDYVAGLGLSDRPADY